MRIENNLVMARKEATGKAKRVIARSDAEDNATILIAIGTGSLEARMGSGSMPTGLLRQSQWQK